MSNQPAPVASPDEPTPQLRVVRGGRNDEPVAFDELGRDTQLLGLIRLISRADPPLVVGVHGDWGEGKTSFMRVLQALLGRNGRDAYRKIEEQDEFPNPGCGARGRCRRAGSRQMGKTPTGDSTWSGKNSRT